MNFNIMFNPHIDNQDKTSHKKSFQRKTSACRDGTLKTSQTSCKRHHNTFTPSLHLVPFCQLCFAFVVLTYFISVLSNGEGSAGCVVHVDVCYVVGGCSTKLLSVPKHQMMFMLTTGEMVGYSQGIS